MLRCPKCGREVYSRKQERCGFCGESLPKEIRLTNEELEIERSNQARIEAAVKTGGPAPSKEQFAKNLQLATCMSLLKARELCWNKFPEEAQYLVHLNCSYDGNPLAPWEVFFPDRWVRQTDADLPRKAEEVVELLWREGKVPEWIDIMPYRVDKDFTFYELLCCGRFTDRDLFLYHQWEGYPPFHALGPEQPNFEYEGKFDLHWKLKRQSREGKVG